MKKKLILFTVSTAFLSLAVVTSAFGRDVELSWSALPGALKYDIQIAKDRNFSQIILKSDSPKPLFDTTLAVGEYFYRVRAIDMQDHPGRWTQSTPFVIGPYAPEPVSPSNNTEITYYEIAPSIEFSWKTDKSGSAPNESYDILITKSTGQEVLEEPVHGTSVKLQKLTEGDYRWRVRAYVQGGRILSTFSDPRSIHIKRLDMKKPELVNPAPNGAASAYRRLEFEWTKDPHAHFTDMYLERLTPTPVVKKIFSNLETDHAVMEAQSVGRYRWWVVAKEGPENDGVTSEHGEFDIRNDLRVGNSYELEVSMSPVNDLYTTSSSLQTLNSQISQQSQSSGLFTGLSGGWYFSGPLGIFLSTRTGRFSVENLTGYQQESQANLRLRFGSLGFTQEFFGGYRVQDVVEAENTPTQQTTDLTVSGPEIGTRFLISLMPRLKLVADGFYMKPISTMETLNGFNADIFGFGGQLKWNIAYQFWIGYRFQFSRVNAQITPANQPSYVTSSWTFYRLEPGYISVSYEH